MIRGIPENAKTPAPPGAAVGAPPGDRFFALRPMQAEDWPSVAAIYGEGLATGDATFESRVPDWEEWDAARRADCRIVAELGGFEAPASGVHGARGKPGGAGAKKRPGPRPPRALAGFACLSPVSKRPVYAGVAEVMVYVAASWRGRGVGGRLLRALVGEADATGVWTLQAHVFPENEASVRLHQRAGFRVAGVRERIGRAPGGRWRSTMLLERRSDRAGLD